LTGGARGKTNLNRYESAMKRKFLTIKRLRKQVRIYFFERTGLLTGIGLVVIAMVALEVMVAGVARVIEKVFDKTPVPSHDWWLIGLSFVLTVGLSCVVWLRRHVFHSLHVRYQIQSEQMPKPYLVIFVSRQTRLTEMPETGPMKIPATKTNPELTLPRTCLLDDASLLADTLSPKEQWPWEMILRGVAPHLKQLRRVYLVGSKDTPGKEASGTFAQCELLHRFLAPYLVAAGKTSTPSGVAHMIVRWGIPVDFESFAEVHETLEAIRDQLTEELAEDVELCVDITGGQKPTSAAAGLFTVNKDVVIQYVQTNPPKQPKMYDVRLLEWPKKPD